VRERKTVRARAATSAGAVVLAFSSMALPAAPGCTTHQCDPSTFHFPAPDGGGLRGRMIDANTYETNGFDEDWIPYGPNVTLIVDYSSVVPPDRVPLDVEPYLAVSISPNDGSSSFVNAAGGLVQYAFINGAGFTVVNTTCATYFARFVVHFEPVTDASAPEDSSVE
jgi:hypothetical protein